MADVMDTAFARLDNFFQRNSGAIIRTIIYTIGHFLIAAGCVWYFTGANLFAAMTDAIVEPIINAGWYFVLDRICASRFFDKSEEE